MGKQRLRLMRGICRVIGHRWDWRLEDDWPHLECKRCGSGWMLGRPIGRRDGQSPVA